MVVCRHRVSIGVPVFNGEKYLRQALNSILAQTYQDFELIISDNASIDKTQQICREYSRRDSRIRYYRNKRNIGAARNFNRVFELSSGEYFKWIAHDDVVAPDYLSKCVGILDREPSIVLCHSQRGYIDENGLVIGTYNYKAIVDSPKPHERFGDLINRNACEMIFGVVRTDVLRRTKLLGGYIAADWNLLAEIGLMGRLYEIPEVLYFRRIHAQAYRTKYYSKPVKIPDYNDQLAWWTGNEARAWLILPHWKNCLELFRAVRRARLNWYDQWLCYKQIGRWLISKGWRLMKWDVAYAINSFRLNLYNV